ncbi:uncharacterized protein LOC134264456 [Saccostrea cucullata]|uniref:uncharacterized protein LOC134264456 n=1 Tax=Saccostrea cuccullata TaxID=36930 RepID=UPI002ED1CE5B
MDPRCVVDGLIGLNDQLVFHSYFELYPWLTIALGQISIVNNVILYNRNDGLGHWLHSVEIRVGMSSSWSEMKVCGRFDGPSQTGQNHTIKCETEPALYGTYVTVKIVRPNYITVEESADASGGKNALVLQEVVVNGYYA